MQMCNQCPYKDWNTWYTAHLHPYFREAEWTPVGIDPRTNEISVRFVYGQFERRIRDIVWQYDTGLKLNIFGIPSELITAVEWCKDGDDQAIILGVTHEQTTDSPPENYTQVDIPDEFLETKGELTGYIASVNQETEAHMTIGIIIITVNERPVPTEPVNG